MKRQILIMYIRKGRHNECDMCISRRMPMTNKLQWKRWDQFHQH